MTIFQYALVVVVVIYSLAGLLFIGEYLYARTVLHQGHKPVWGKWCRYDGKIQIRECTKCGYTQSRSI